MTGGLVGVGVTYAAVVNERTRRVWQQTRVRVGSIFLVAVGVQAGLAVVPVPTLLVLVTACLTMVPARTYVYLRAG